MPVTIDGDDIRVPGTVRASSFLPKIDSGQFAQRNLQEDVIDMLQCRVPLARMANAAGVGITGAATSFVTSVDKIGSLIKTTILIDLTGLNSGGTADDIIGDDGTGVAHLGQITAAVNGTVIAGRLTCLETPATGDDDIDVYSATEATGVEDTLVTAPAADQYLYLVGGTGGSATYTAGILLLEFWGKGATDELSVVNGTLGTNAPSLQTEDLRDVGATTRYARFLVPLPSEYVAGETVQLRFPAGMITNAADTTATLDVECYKSDEDNTVSADLCETAAQSMNSTTFADLDFTITATNLSPGDMLDVRRASRDSATRRGDPMRRYRKGDTFRPPTAAESAVSADALEGFRRRPPQPQDQVPRSHMLLVKTPAGGIAARDGDTLSSATCTRCIESSEAGTKTLLDTDESITVYNPYEEDIPGDIYVLTGLTESGTRCVIRPDTSLRWGKLDSALSSGGTATVSLWQTTGGGWEGWDEDSTENWTCYAPPLLSSGSIASGKWVLVGIVNGRKVVLLPEC
jgi:hypothetical protein